MVWRQPSLRELQCSDLHSLNKRLNCWCSADLISLASDPWTRKRIISKARAHGCVGADERWLGDLQITRTQIRPSSDTGVQRLTLMEIQCLTQGLSPNKMACTFKWVSEVDTDSPILNLRG